MSELPRNPQPTDTAEPPRGSRPSPEAYRSYRGLHEPLHQGSHSVKIALVASEDIEKRSSITNELEAMGWQVISSPSVQGSLGHLSPATDSIFIDPRIGGVRTDTLLPKIKALHPSGQVIVVDSQNQNSPPLGADFVLPFPFEPEALRQIAKKSLETRRLLTPQQTGARFH